MIEESQLIKESLKGNRKSLAALIDSIQEYIFNISLRFLWDKLDAEDATQEILVKVITNLSKFQHKSKFKTWVYRIATNYLINLKKTEVENVLVSFDVYAEDLKTFSAPKEYNLPDKELLEKELKTSCTLAMLQCLNREHRLTFILGSILKLKSNVGAEITNTSPANFRKRLEKSRKVLGGFLNKNCGVYNPDNACRCSARINTALKCGRIVKGNLNFVDKVEVYNEEMEELGSISELYQNHGSFKSKTNFIDKLNELLQSKQITQ